MPLAGPCTLSRINKGEASINIPIALNDDDVATLRNRIRAQCQPPPLPSTDARKATYNRTKPPSSPNTAIAQTIMIPFSMKSFGRIITLPPTRPEGDALPDTDEFAAAEI
ncbi:MAG: hypothetical protein Q9181_007485 [Wetmoreana brouardii]